MAKQPIAYWGTEIAASRSATEILALLVEYRAEQTGVEWDEKGEPTAVTFTLRDPELGRIPVRLDARVEEVTKLLLEQKPYNANYRYPEREHAGRLREQARRVVWRHLRDLVEQQLLAVRIGQYRFVDVFLHGVQVRTPTGSDTLGRWMHEAIKTGGFNADPSGRLLLAPPGPKDKP